MSQLPNDPILADAVRAVENAPYANPAFVDRVCQGLMAIDAELVDLREFKSTHVNGRATAQAATERKR